MKDAEAEVDEEEGVDMIVRIEEAEVAVIAAMVVGLVTEIGLRDQTKMLDLGPEQAHQADQEEVDMEVDMVTEIVVDMAGTDMEIGEDREGMTEIVEVIDTEIEILGGTGVDLLPRTPPQEEHPWRERSSKSLHALSPCRRPPRQLRPSM